MGIPKRDTEAAQCLPSLHGQQCTGPSKQQGREAGPSGSEEDSATRSKIPFLQIPSQRGKVGPGMNQQHPWVPAPLTPQLLPRPWHTGFNSVFSKLENSGVPPCSPKPSPKTMFGAFKFKPLLFTLRDQLLVTRKAAKVARRKPLCP